MASAGGLDDFLRLCRSKVESGLKSGLAQMGLVAQNQSPVC